MSNGVNMCVFIGNLGKDPEESRKDDSTRTTFSMAINDKRKDRATGNNIDHTEWVNFVAFGKTAEIIGQYAKKGSQMYVQGKLQTRAYEDTSGQKKYFTEVMVREFQFVGGKAQNNGDAKPAQESNQAAYQQGQDDFDDDIPFS